MRTPAAGPNRNTSSLAALLIALVWVTGCGVEGDDRPAYGGEGLGGASSHDSDPHSHGSSCPEGTVRDCRVTIHQASGVTSCWDGVQLCESGRWGGCMDPDELEFAEPDVLEPTR